MGANSSTVMTSSRVPPKKSEHALAISKGMGDAKKAVQGNIDRVATSENLHELSIESRTEIREDPYCTLPSKTLSKQSLWAQDSSGALASLGSFGMRSSAKSHPCFIGALFMCILAIVVTCALFFTQALATSSSNLSSSPGASKSSLNATVEDSFVAFHSNQVIGVEIYSRQDISKADEEESKIALNHEYTGTIRPYESKSSLADEGGVSIRDTQKITFDAIIRSAKPDRLGRKDIMTIIKGRAYLETVDAITNHLWSASCIPDYDIPPVAEVARAILNSESIESVEGAGVVQCPNDTARLHATEFSGEVYAFCQNLTSGFISHVVSSDIQIVLLPSYESDTRLDETTTSSFSRIPKDPEGNNLQCPVSSSLSGDIGSDSINTDNENLSNVRHSASRMHDTRGARRLNAEIDSSKATETSSRWVKLQLDQPRQSKCGGKMRKCVFFHGLGTEVEEIDLLDSYELYWGLVHNTRLACCRQVEFARLDTKTVGWTDPKLRSQFCDILRDKSANDDDSHVIKDTIVITHSMANLAFSLALADYADSSEQSDGCTLHNRSSAWVSLQGPMRGSPVANEISAICNYTANDNAISTQIGKSRTLKLENAILTGIGICPIQPIVELFYDTEGPHLDLLSSDMAEKISKEYLRAQKAFAQNVKAVLCGSSPYGLPSMYSLGLGLISARANIEEPSDGVVPVGSCMAGLSQSQKNSFRDTYESKFYLASVNHMDGTFRNGDGLWGKNRKPQKWLRELDPFE